MFDAQTEKMNESPVWVKLPGLPLQFWTDSVFTSIGNTLGKYLEVDRSFIQTNDLSVARILVSLNPREGLADAMTLKYREMEFLQKLDYKNFPFRCHRCHKYGHFAKACPLGHRRKRNHYKISRKPMAYPAPDPGKDVPQEPMEEDSKADMENVTTSVPVQQAVPDPLPENAPALSASLTPTTAETTGASQAGMPLSLSPLPFVFLIMLLSLLFLSLVLLGSFRWSSPP